MLLVHRSHQELEGVRLWEKSLGVVVEAQKAGLGDVAGPMAFRPLQEKLERVILGSKASQQQPEAVRGLWQTCGELMFSLEPRLRHLGLGKEVRTPTIQGSGGCPFRPPGMEKRDSMGMQQALSHTLEAQLFPPADLSFAICKMGSKLDGMLSDILGCCVQKEGRREELRAGES